MKEAESPQARQAQAPKLHHAVFVSYSSDDEEVAGAVCSALEAGAIHCWMASRDVQVERPYSGQITQAIREARVLLLVLSKASNRSKQVLREVERAAHCQSHVLTFRIDAIAPGDDLAYYLGAGRWVDGFRPLPPSEHFPVLIQHTRALLQREAVESDPEAQADGDGPEAFAHFRVLRRPDGSLFRLGKGGMGVTYKAIDTVLNRPVALKVIAAEPLRSSASRQRFLREAQAAALIHQPHVATIFHFGEEGDAYFYAMEFVDGVDLERYVAQHGPLPPTIALRVVSQVAQALEAAQVHRLIHRDIKPGNVMAVTNRAGSLDMKLIDFGLATGTGTEALDAARITRTRDFVGSPAFASPEQCEMQPLDTRSDIYSLGVTLWYLLSGKRPFSGTVGQVLIAQVVRPPPFEQLAQVPEPVIAILERMLRKDREQRFQTPNELQDAVEAAAVKLASEFGAVPERLAVEFGTAQLDNQAEPAMENQAEPVLLTAPASPLLDMYLAVEVGALAANRYRLVSEEREGNGGRLFHAKDQRAAAGQPSEVVLKLVHPGIAADPELLDLLENEIEVIRQATHPHLVPYWRVERASPGPWLVRDWVHGFLLFDLLRWRQSLRADELLALLGPLASTVDYVSSQGLRLVDVSVRKILVACPSEISPEKFPEFARGDARAWSRCRLLLNPLSLAPLLFRSRNGWDRQTIVPASRVLSTSRTQAGIKGSKAVRLYGRLVYELLSGHASIQDANSQKYTPLPELDQEGNETLRRACVSTDPAHPNCEAFWKALKENLAGKERSFTHAAQPPASISPVVSSRPPARPPKRNLVVGTVAGVALIIALALVSVTRSGRPGAGPQVIPTPSAEAAKPVSTPAITITANPTASIAVATPDPAPVATATPTPIPVAVTITSPSISATPLQEKVTTKTPYKATFLASLPLVQKAAAAGNIDAMNNLAVLYQNGRGLAQSYDKAREWFQKAADAGDVDAMNSLGELYYYGRGVARDYTQARDWYEKAAAGDNANAMYSLGWMYEKGSGVIIRDYTQARKWYERAAAAGNTEANYNLGVLYQNGQGVAQDYNKAREWLQKAADAGNADAMNNLGELYSYAQGVARDYTQARNWYQRAAAAGSTEAMCNIGVLYRNGQGVPQNYGKAREWFQKAADAGNADATNKLGELYYYAQGVARDYTPARNWYQRAAAAGNAKAMYNLGVLYENGEGVAQDYGKAREWYQMAADLGDADAKQALLRLGQGAILAPESSTPRSTQKILYQDDFSRLDPSWGIFGDILSVKDSKLILKPAVNTTQSVLNLFNIFNDADIQVEVTLASGAPTVAGGLVFWAKDYTDFYCLSIDANGSFKISHFVTSGWLIPIAWTKSEAINKGVGQVNKLRIVTKGVQMTAFINDKQVITMTGQPLPGGGCVGISGSSDLDRQSTWQFSNLRVMGL
jgi:TPR repeat protein/serine/threonine protein kinase